MKWILKIQARRTVVPDYEIGTLVDLVVNTAKTDTTTPDLQNLRNGWVTDLLLTQMIDRLVVGKYNNPDAYIEIGWQVLAGVGGLPEMEALSLLAVLRGERLLPLNEHREQVIFNLIKDLDRTIAALPEGPRKARCKSLFDYHQGIFYDTCGRFDLAAKFQLQSAMEAMQSGDFNGFSIGTFMASVFTLKHSLCSDKSDFPISSIFASMETHFHLFVIELKGSPLEVLWAQVNGPVFMLEACVWTDREHSEWDNWVKTALAGMEKLGSSWDLCANFVRAIDMDQKGDPRAAEALNAAADSNDANERRAAALLILARRAIEREQPEQACGFMSRMPEQGAQHVVAVAKLLIGE